MFTVNLYTLAKKENSTKQPNSSPSSFQCMLKDNSGIVNPTIILDIGLNTSPSQYNYAYIPEFNRYYWITEWTNEHPLWIASLEVDVLATYKSQIGNTNLYVLRASNEYDGNINDSMYPAKVSNTTNTITASNIWNTTLNTTAFILGVVSKGAQFGSIRYYALYRSSLEGLSTALLDDTLLESEQGGFNPDDASLALQKSLIDPLSYIKSCVALPIAWADVSGVTTNELNIWSWTLGSEQGVTGVKAVNVSTPKYTTSFTINIPKHPQTTSRGYYCNCAPYTELDLLIPPFNSISLDASITAKVNSLTCEISIDYITGAGVLEVKAGDFIINRSEAQVGVPIQLSQVSKDYLGQVMNGANTVGSVVGNALTGNVAGAITGAISGIGNGIALAQPRQYSTGSNGNFTQFTFPPKLFAKFYTLVDDDLASHGRPLCKIRRPSALGGYMLIQDADVSIAGTDFELSKVRSYLESGFYYE